MRVRIAAVVAAWSLMSCQHDQQAPTGLQSEIRDSADIRIVENTRPPDDSRLPWRIGPEPSVSIGVLEGEEPYMLDGVIDALVLSDGRIVVANQGTYELRVFNPSGIHFDTWGGEGEGPGEFPYLRGLERWPGDSVAAWYGLRRGISVFDAVGNFGRNFTLERNEDDPGAFAVMPKSVTHDGLVLTTHDPHMIDTVLVEIRDGEGGIRSSLGIHSGQEMQLVDGMMYQTMFGARVAQEPWGDLIVISQTNRYELKAFSRDGTPERIVRRGHEPRAVTQGDVDAYIDASIEEEVPYYPDDLSESDIRTYQAEERRRYRSAPFAEHFPAFTSLVVDALDYLWVQEYEFPGEERPGSLWTVFDPAGRVLGFVETPDGLQVFEIGEHYILGLRGDEFDVESVEVWALERSDG